MNARGHLSSETIDLLLLSALSAPETNEAKAHLDTCGSCKARWVELNEDKQRFEQFVFPRTLAKVEARAAAERGGFFERFKLKLVIPSLVMVAAAVTLVVATQGPTQVDGPGTQTEDDAYVGIKGAPTLEVFAMRNGGGAFPVQPNMELQPSDRIRFVVNPADAKYVLVASTDGAGEFSVYAPFGAGKSQLVKSAAKQELPGSIELDDTIGVENIVAAFSNEPLTAEQVQAAVLLDAKNPKLPGVSFVTREFRKVAP